MYSTREFKNKLLEVFHVLIGIQLPKLWNLDAQLWAPILKTIEYTEESNIKMV